MSSHLLSSPLNFGSSLGTSSVLYLQTREMRNMPEHGNFKGKFTLWAVVRWLRNFRSHQLIVNVRARKDIFLMVWNYWLCVRELPRSNLIRGPSMLATETGWLPPGWIYILLFYSQLLRRNGSRSWSAAWSRETGMSFAMRWFWILIPSLRLLCNFSRGTRPI